MSIVISDVFDGQKFVNRITLSHWNIFNNTSLEEAIDILQDVIIPSLQQRQNSFSKHKIVDITDFNMRRTAFSDIENYSSTLKLWIDAEIMEFSRVRSKNVVVDHYVQEDNILYAKELIRENEDLYEQRQKNITSKVIDFLEYIKQKSLDSEAQYLKELKILNEKYGK